MTTEVAGDGALVGNYKVSFAKVTVEDDGLPDEVDPCGENGEFHSFVYNGPIFQRPVDINVGEVVLRDVRYFADLLPRDQRVKKRA